jgi:NTP pyrophosphatase (non-canonical NTP hydrolase)
MYRGHVVTQRNKHYAKLIEEGMIGIKMHVVDRYGKIEEVSDPKELVKISTDTPKRKTDIYKRIGVPALLEQCAEECAELTQALLKVARITRGENPSPKPFDDAIENLEEEMADVAVCLEEVYNTGIIDEELINKTKQKKLARWLERTE